MRITYEGPPETFESQLQRGGSELDAGGIDISYRLRDPIDADGEKGVLAIADRVTGEYVLELNADSDTLLQVTEAVSERDDNGHYRLVIENEEGDELASYEKSTLLVYDTGGELLREQSLIPSGVEI